VFGLDERLGLRVAVKRLSATVLPQLLRHFAREARVGQRLD
jgi:hypothetical protein